MKQICMIALVAFASTAALAQAPAGTLARPSQESNAAQSGGKPADKAQMKTDMKKDGAMPMASSGGMAMGSGTAHSSMGMKAMDKNGDGMISQREWNAHHNGMWGKMKKEKGMVSMAEMEAMMKSGPN